MICTCFGSAECFTLKQRARQSRLGGMWPDRIGQQPYGDILNLARRANFNNHISGVFLGLKIDRCSVAAVSSCVVLQRGNFLRLECLLRELRERKSEGSGHRTLATGRSLLIGWLYGPSLEIACISALSCFVHLAGCATRASVPRHLSLSGGEFPARR